MRMTPEQYNARIVKDVAKKTKFRNVKKEIDGLKFDSTKEANHYLALKVRERLGEINGLVTQPKFSIDINGQHICNYIADFAFFTYENDETVYHVQDVKSAHTRTLPVYRLKKKLMKAVLNTDIEEI